MLNGGEGRAQGSRRRSPPQDEAPSGTAQTEIRAAGVGSLKLETFSGSRNPMHFRDWKMQVEAVRLLSGLSDEKLTVYAWMSL